MTRVAVPCAGQGEVLPTGWEDFYVERKLDGERMIVHWRKTGLEPDQASAARSSSSSSAAGSKNNINGSGSGSSSAPPEQLRIYSRKRHEERTYQQVSTSRGP